MLFKLCVEKPTMSAAIAAAAFLLGALMMPLVISDFVVGTLTDERIELELDREGLAAAAKYFRSSRLEARLAMAEFDARNFAEAERRAARAVEMSPRNYEYRVLLASIKEAAGDRSAAERELLAALELAPSNVDVRWRLANLLLRSGKLNQSLEHFRAATSKNPQLLPATLDLVWQVSGGDAGAVKAVVGEDPEARLSLAEFLLDKSRAADGVEVFKSVPRESRLASAKSSSFLSALIKAGQPELARDLWIELKGGGGSDAIWNGGFESSVAGNLNHFDWRLDQSKFARTSIDPRVAHSGARSLRIDFLGLDTTRLDGEVTQLVILRPGARYALECYFKTEKLVTPEGPRVEVREFESGSPIASSEPLPAGSSDWQRLEMEFVATRSAALVSIVRRPKFSYDDPTKGTIWFDDFKLTELK